MTDEERQLISIFLQLSRDRISEGNGHEALSAVINAIRVSTGADEAGLMRILDEARIRASMEQRRTLHEQAYQCCVDLVNQDTLLAEMGDENILVDAFQDGSSVICQKCKGLVPVDRAEQHSKYWCETLNDMEMDDVQDCYVNDVTGASISSVCSGKC